MSSRLSLRQLSILLLFTTTLLAQPAEKDPQLILEQAFKSMGGIEKIESVQTKTASGKVTVAGLSGTYSMEAKAPDKIRSILDLGVLRQERGFDGSSGWQKQNSLQTLTGDDLERLKRSAAFNPLLDYYKRKVAAVWKGTEKIENHEAERIEFSTTDGTEVYYFRTDDFLPIREIRNVPMEGQPLPLQIDYSDYREVDGIKIPYTIIQTLPGQVLQIKIDSYQLNAKLDDSIFQNPAEAFQNVPYEVTLSTIPKNVYVENDGVWEPATTESSVFHIVVQEKHGRPLDPVAAKIEMYSEGDLVETRELSADALETIRGISFSGFNNIDEVFDLRHFVSVSTGTAVDKIVYKLNLVTTENEKIQKSIDIPLLTYEQKSELLFPIRGNFVVGGGHDANEPHKSEWSQHYAYDIIGLGPHFEMIKNKGVENDDYIMWGQEVIAPADGKIVYARNDVPDNQAPGKIDRDVFMKLPDPIRAFSGNNVVIDHGNGEFSFLAHLKMGSVKVKQGESVKAGQVIGLLGNSGNSDAPHLHYQFMAGPMPFRNDGLPSKFKNLWLELLTLEKLQVEIPKRGVYLRAE